ncbi:hypothetical protein J7E97_11060 [Streptomyces sp. ISL-66]|uniref:hypothetical protein n=1 Tax=Streptomyces sp. ISL-66 TaxID=2819186 RepID=UPI001BE749B0|nr:hypothetical protein [Streptomyces sp. ISL-66]MBT2468401.1 hypothetical protein [Streptomyces sp. ISL-66]
MTWWQKAGIAIGVLAIVVVSYGLMAIGYHSPDDPYIYQVGVRITDGRITVNVPTCPQGGVKVVRLKDYLRRKTLWTATEPLTPEAQHGTITLWQSEDFREASAGEQPAVLPRVMEVWVTTKTRDGSGALFRPDEVAAAELPDGAYWTKDGPGTAAQINRRRFCNR